MPEKEIPYKLAKPILNWVRQKGGQEILPLHVFIVDGEPLTLDPASLLKDHVAMSEKHAQELEEAGIVSFQEVKEEAK